MLLWRPNTGVRNSHLLSNDLKTSCHATSRVFQNTIFNGTPGYNTPIAIGDMCSAIGSTSKVVGYTRGPLRRVTVSEATETTLRFKKFKKKLNIVIKSHSVTKSIGEITKLALIAKNPDCAYPDLPERFSRIFVLVLSTQMFSSRRHLHTAVLVSPKTLTCIVCRECVTYSNSFAYIDSRLCRLNVYCRSVSMSVNAIRLE